MAADGRVVIPAAIRAALGIKRGSRLSARIVDGAVVLEPLDAAVRRAQALVARYAAGEPMADELIAERHEAARRD